MPFEEILLEKEPRKTPISWEDLISNIIDQYRQYVDDISHAVQKDAVQNSWDAKTGKSNWVMNFKLLKDSNGKEIFIIEDHGTTGLTGRSLPEEEYDKDLPEEERWGRFQGLAFRRENPKALGARGQGKFVFVGSSKTRTILYDTLRSDGVYRLGVRILGNLWEREGSEAGSLLKTYSPDLDTLSQIGTRIIIDTPISELTHALRRGKFMRYIQTTWWPLIAERKMEATIDIYGKKWKVTYPKDLVFPRSDSKTMKVWVKDWVKIRGTKKKDLRGLHIKKLHICWSKDPILDDIRGIAILRGGMVVERIPVLGLLSSNGVQLAKNIYGYIEGDMGVQYLLKKIEDPTHYRFRKRGGWGRKNIFGQIKEYVAGQLQIFANEKLGLRKGFRETGDLTAIRTFNKIIKSLNISILSPAVPVLSKGGGLSPPKDLDLKLPSPDFPDPTRKVDFGEEVSNIRFEIVNRTGKSADVRLKVYTEQDWIVRDTIIDKTYQNILPSFTLSDGPFSFKIDKKYTKGKCHLRGRLVCLKHPQYEKGTNLDRTAHIFWIAQEAPPRGKGPFREIERRANLSDRFNGRNVRIAWKSVPHPDNGYILLINLGHPIYRKRCSSKNEEKDYIIEVMARELPHILISNDHEIFRRIDDPDEILRRSSIIFSEIMDQYHSI